MKPTDKFNGADLVVKTSFEPDEWKYSLSGPINSVTVNGNSVVYADQLTAAEKTIAKKDAKIKELEYLNAELKQWRSEDQSAIEEKDHKITQLEQQLKEATEIIEFYGNKRNWSKDYEVSGEVSRYTSMFNDQEEINQSTTFSGERARAYLAKRKGE